MRNIPVALFAVSALVLLQTVPSEAGQYSMDPRIPGVKYCPAPGADNSEFLHSYWAVDAKTGEMSKITATDHPTIPAGYDTNQQQEEVLFVAPNISVENRYVPYPGASAQEPPPEFRQASRPAPAPVMPAPAPVSSRPRRQAARPMPAPPALPQSRQPNQYREQYQLPPAQVSQTAAVAVPKAPVVASRAPEVKATQEKVKKSAHKRISKSKTQSEKQPWWRHIWRN